MCSRMNFLWYSRIANNAVCLVLDLLPLSLYLLSNLPIFMAAVTKTHHRAYYPWTMSSPHTFPTTSSPRLSHYYPAPLFSHLTDLLVKRGQMNMCTSTSAHAWGYNREVASQGKVLPGLLNLGQARCCQQQGFGLSN